MDWSHLVAKTPVAMASAQKCKEKTREQQGNHWKPRQTSSANRLEISFGSLIDDGVRTCKVILLIFQRDGTPFSWLASITPLTCASAAFVSTRDEIVIPALWPKPISHSPAAERGLAAQIAHITTKATKGKSIMEISDTITIEAPADRVWTILTEFAAYAQWNPFMDQATGTPVVGSRLKIRFHSPGSRPTTLRSKVLFADPGRELR